VVCNFGVRSDGHRDPGDPERGDSVEEVVCIRIECGVLYVSVQLLWHEAYGSNSIGFSFFDRRRFVPATVTTHQETEGGTVDVIWGVSGTQHQHRQEPPGRTTQGIIRNRTINIIEMGTTRTGGNESVNERVRGQVYSEGQTWKLTVHPLRTCLLHLLRERGQVTQPRRLPRP